MLLLLGVGDGSTQHAVGGRYCSDKTILPMRVTSVAQGPRHQYTMTPYVTNAGCRSLNHSFRVAGPYDDDDGTGCLPSYK
jgi:hypothetical protein